MINEYKQTAVDIAALLTVQHRNSFISREFILKYEETITLKFIRLLITYSFIHSSIHSFIVRFLKNNGSFDYAVSNSSKINETWTGKYVIRFF
jgi:hypothetical protein